MGEGDRSGEDAHFRALESLYAKAPIQKIFVSTLNIVEAGVSELRFTVDDKLFHAAGAAHGTTANDIDKLYFISRYF